MDTYLYRDGQQQGPFSKEDISGMLESGEITYDDLFWCEGMDDWQRLEARYLTATELNPSPQRSLLSIREEPQVSPSHLEPTIGFILAAAAPCLTWLALHLEIFWPALCGFICGAAGSYLLLGTYVPNPSALVKWGGAFVCGLWLCGIPVLVVDFAKSGGTTKTATALSSAAALQNRPPVVSTSSPVPLRQVTPPSTSPQKETDANTASQIYQLSGEAALAAGRAFVVGTWAYTGQDMKFLGQTYWV
ncbi:MAG: hypothetical protein QOD99_2353, partial [Chthoniobacter sp.]|nr:hypothetical protein [Chthoniobacter sp.]